jgi:hypothetical protein
LMRLARWRPKPTFAPRSRPFESPLSSWSAPTTRAEMSPDPGTSQSESQAHALSSFRAGSPDPCRRRTGSAC